MVKRNIIYVSLIFFQIDFICLLYMQNIVVLDSMEHFQLYESGYFINLLNFQRP